MCVSNPGNSIVHLCTMSLIAELYTSVLVPILSDWISDQDVTHLDSACCCSLWRDRFLIVLSQCKISNDDVFYYDIYLQKCQWIALRGISVKNFIVKKSLSSFEQIVLTNTKTLHLLQGRSGSYLIKALDLCPNIQTIKLKGGLGKFDDLVSRLSNISGLDLQYITDLEKVVKEFLSSFRELRYLAAPAVDAAPLIRNNRNLTEVSIYLTNENVTELINSSHLTSIRFLGVHWGTKSVNETVVQLAEQCPQLRHYAMTASFIEDATVSRLAECCSLLTSLELAGHKLTDVSLVALSSHCRFLSKLSVSSKLITDPGVIACATYCPLRYLSLSLCISVTEYSIREVLLRCKQIEELNIWGAQFSNAFVKQAFCENPHLLVFQASRFEVNDTSRINGVSVRGIVVNSECVTIKASILRYKQFRRNFHERILYGITPLSTADFDDLFYDNPNLIALSVNNNESIVNTTLKMLVSHCLHIASLTLTSCEGVSGEAVACLANSCLPLKRIHFEQLDNIETGDIVYLLKNKSSTLRYAVFSHLKKAQDLLMEIQPHTEMLTSLSVSGANLKTSELCRFISHCEHILYIEWNGYGLLQSELQQAVKDCGRKAVWMHITENQCCLRF